MYTNSDVQTNLSGGLTAVSAVSGVLSVHFLEKNKIIDHIRARLIAALSSGAISSIGAFGFQNDPINLLLQVPSIAQATLTYYIK